MLKAAFRRFLVLLAMVAGVTAALSLLIGLASGSSATRAVSLGFYLIGSFLLISGFFVRERIAVDKTVAEQEETINMSAVFVAIGLTLIVLGVAADPRYKLF